MNKKLSLIFARRSVRNYQDKDVPQDMLDDILAAAMSAPSACAKDPWRFYVTRRRDILSRMAEVLPNGKMLQNAPLGVLVCGNIQEAHAGELSYLLQDCSAAIENFLLAASVLGLGACWLGVHPRPERIVAMKEIFQLPEHLIPVSVIAVGWPADKPSPRSRFNPASVIQV